MTATPIPESRPEAGVREVLQDLWAQRSAFRAFLARRVEDEATAEDLLQQSFVRAVQQDHGTKPPEQAVAWFYRILRNAVVDHYRARGADTRKSEAFRLDRRASGDDHIPGPDELRPALCACLHRLLPSLRPAYAELLRRIDLEGEPPAAVAQALGVTPNNLTVRLHRARLALRKSLEQTCGICTKHGCLDCTCD